MNPSSRSLNRAWELLKADSIESVDNPLLENRLMNEMKKQSAPRTWKRKLALAAALLVGFLAIGSGISFAAGYNPFKTLTILFSNDGVVITDENGNQVDGSLVNMKVEENGGSKTVTVELKGGENGKVQLRSVEQPK